MSICFDCPMDLASSIKTGRLSSTEVLEAHLQQIDQFNPGLNAVVTLDMDGDRARARKADEALSHGEVWGPLHGVPYTQKDAIGTAGVRTTSGFQPLAGYVPLEDSTIASRLKSTGAIVVGKTNVFEVLADPAQTINPIFGRTNNPWNHGCTPGGSSGGASAAVAAGMSPFDIGTDLSGSIRVPAHFCGLFGLKPTENRVPLTGLIHGLPLLCLLRIMSTAGPLARTLSDLELLFIIIAGPDGADTEVPSLQVSDISTPELKDLRIAFASHIPDFPVAGEICKAVEVLAAHLDRLGAVVEQAVLPKLDLTQDLMHAGELIGMTIGVFQSDGQPSPTTLTKYLEELDRRDRSILAWEQFFQSWNVLLCPVAPITAFTHCLPSTPLSVDGKEMPYWMISAYTTIFNYSGPPAIVVPLKQDRDGLPIGVQLVGRRWEEYRLLEIAKVILQVTGGFHQPPGYDVQ